MVWLLSGKDMHDGREVHGYHVAIVVVLVCVLMCCHLENPAGCEERYVKP